MDFWLVMDRGCVVGSLGFAIGPVVVDLGIWSSDGVQGSAGWEGRV